MLTSGIISGDQVAVKRIFSLISRPLDDFKDLYYPSFAEWVSCQVCQFWCYQNFFLACAQQSPCCVHVLLFSFWIKNICHTSVFKMMGLLLNFI